MEAGRCTLAPACSQQTPEMLYANHEVEGGTRRYGVGKYRNSARSDRWQRASKRRVDAPRAAVQQRPADLNESDQYPSAQHRREGRQLRHAGPVRHLLLYRSRCAGAGIRHPADVRLGGEWGAGQLRQAGNRSAVESGALLLNYYFRDPQEKLRPYVGVGVTRTWFTDASITNSSFEQGLAGGPTTVSTDRAWAPVFKLGVNYAVTRACYELFVRRAMLAG